MSAWWEAPVDCSVGPSQPGRNGGGYFEFEGIAYIPAPPVEHGGAVGVAPLRVLGATSDEAWENLAGALKDWRAEMDARERYKNIPRERRKL